MGIVDAVMMDKNLKGGKTAPRLLQDLLLYDPRKLPVGQFNVLTDIPYHDAEQEDHLPPSALIGRGSCRHQWSLKRKQCSLPKNGYKATEQTTWLIAAFCAVCRSHLELVLDFRHGGSLMKPCPTEKQLLHHFVHRPDLSESDRTGTVHAQREDGFRWVDTQVFECSSYECHAQLTVRFKPPRLTQDWVDLLTDRFIIKTRAERAIAEAPQRFEGFAVPPPIDVLLTAKHYITNPLLIPEKSKRIQGHNKRFLLGVGEPCADLLVHFGFTREETDWLPPQAEPAEDVPFTNLINIRIDDAEKELNVLMSQASNEEKRKVKHDWAPVPAIKEMKDTLGCVNYEKTLRSRTIDLTQNTEEHPFYAGLGAVEDFHDNLLIFAYEQQIAVDSLGTGYYLECLQGIAEGRNSEQLQLKVAIEATSGKISQRDIRVAYRDLGLDRRERHEDDTIIGIFKSRVTDAPKQEPEMRRALKVIGQDRDSEKIQVVASQSVTNYEQALSFLGASSDTADEFIPSMYTLKVSERVSDEATARLAVVLIASHRNSLALKNFLNTGEIGEVEMDVDTAYARLDISERNVDDDLLLSIYSTRVADDPSQLDSLKNALTAIGKSRNSRRLNEFLGSGAISPSHSLSEWPVGLENIGNTCYLNSLLQFYFTIKPLRELVLNIDQYKMPTDEASLKSKRVGSRNVLAKEVARAQNFVDELRKLYRNMIVSSKASVTPEPELARLTLLSSDKADFIRRQSILSPTRPSLGEIHGMPVAGPLGPPLPAVIDDTEMIDVQSPAIAGGAVHNGSHDTGCDSSSDVTLVDGPEDLDADAMLVDDKEKLSQQDMFEDKENLPPIKEPVKEPSPDVELIPLGESSPSRVNEQNRTPKIAEESANDALDLTKDDLESPKTIRGLLDDEPNTTIAAPPKRSPPLPPRPKQIDTTASNALQEAEVGAQQDVTEVIANFLFQLQCAIKAESIDETGEQVDRVKELFFGKQKSYTTDKEGKTRTKEEYMSDIKVDVASGPRDIYTALDGAYDVQDVEVGGGVEPQYTSISVLPPVLQVHVQRSLYDRQKKAAFKSTNHLDLKETIFMDRYMDSNDPDLLERRRQCWQWKAEILELEQRQAQLTKSDIGMDMPEVLENLQGYLHQISSLEDGGAIDVPRTLINDLGIAAKEAKVELDSLEDQLRDLQSNVASQFSDMRKIPYRLQSVFVHRGYHNSGHYWIYIFDFNKKMWRKYNDGYVTEVRDTNEIFIQEPGDRPATPYFLVYVKDDAKGDLVDSVRRELVDPEPQEQADSIMEDYSQPLELPSVSKSDSHVPIGHSARYGVTESYQVPYEGQWDNYMNVAAPTNGW